MCNHKEAAKTVMALLEDDFQFNAEERFEALLLALKILADVELLEELEGAERFANWLVR